MPIRKWNNWDRMSASDDFWVDVDNLEQARRQVEARDALEKYLQQRRDAAVRRQHMSRRQSRSA